MHSDDEPGSLRAEAERLRADAAADAAKHERDAPPIKKAFKAARGAGWGAESDGLVKLLTFFGVLAKESMPERTRRGRQPRMIEAVRVRRAGRDAHAHVEEVQLSDGAVRPAKEIVFGIRYRRDIYVSSSEDGDGATVIVSSCPSCGSDRLSTEAGEDLLLAMRRF